MCDVKHIYNIYKYDYHIELQNTLGNLSFNPSSTKQYHLIKRIPIEPL